MSERDLTLVLRRVEHGEADLILTLLARSRGKISARARGARRSKRRFGAALGWFVIAETELTRRGNAELHTLVGADVREAFVDLAADPVALSHASYATELVRELLGTEQAEPAVFDLLVELYRSARRGSSRAVLRRFEIALLDHLGMAPDFARCAACGGAEPERFERGAVLDPGGAGVVCAGCAAAIRGVGVRPLSAGARRCLLAAGLDPAHHGGESEVEPGVEPEVEIEAQQAMQAILSRHLSRPLRSLEFIAKMNAPGPR